MVFSYLYDEKAYSPLVMGLILIPFGLYLAFRSAFTLRRTYKK